VIAMDQENVTALGEELNSLRSFDAFKNICIRAIVYTKDHEVNIAAIRADIDATVVQTLPNTAARVGLTHLTYFQIGTTWLVTHSLLRRRSINQSRWQIAQRTTPTSLPVFHP